MADTYTAHYTLTKPQIGIYDAAWGTKWAANLDAIDAALWVKVDAAGGTLTNPVINGFTGTGAASITGLLAVTNKVAAVTHNSTGLTELQIGNTVGTVTGDGQGVGFYFGGTRLAGIRNVVKGGSYKTTISSWTGSAESEVLDIDASGNVLVISQGGLGYGTGAGGTVTQATSRTTAVTINKPTGRITMFSAAGSASWASFTVNNSTIAAADTVVLSQVGGSNAYIFRVDVGAGSFVVSFSSVIGTSVDVPGVGFAVIKGATA